MPRDCSYGFTSDFLSFIVVEHSKLFGSFTEPFYCIAKIIAIAKLMRLLLVLQ